MRPAAFLSELGVKGRAVFGESGDTAGVTFRELFHFVQLLLLCNYRYLIANSMIALKARVNLKVVTCAVIVSTEVITVSVFVNKTSLKLFLSRFFVLQWLLREQQKRQ